MKTTVIPPWNTNTFPWMTYGISSLNQQYLLHHLPHRASALSVNERKNENTHTSPCLCPVTGQKLSSMRWSTLGELSRWKEKDFFCWVILHSLVSPNCQNLTHGLEKGNGALGVVQLQGQTNLQTDVLRILLELPSASKERLGFLTICQNSQATSDPYPGPPPHSVWWMAAGEREAERETNGFECHWVTGWGGFRTQKDAHQSCSARAAIYTPEADGDKSLQHYLLPNWIVACNGRKLLLRTEVSGAGKRRRPANQAGDNRIGGTGTQILRRANPVEHLSTQVTGSLSHSNLRL